MSQTHPVDLGAPVRRKERAITDRAEIDAILNEGKVLHLAMSHANRPFLVPMFYAYAGGALYLHSAAQGTKVAILKENPFVCFEVSLNHGVIPDEKACDFEARHRTAIGMGKVIFVEDHAEKVRALDAIVARFTDKKFEYPAPALTAATVLRIEIESIKGKKHGACDEGFSL